MTRRGAESPPNTVILNPEGVKNLVAAFVNLSNEILRFAQNDIVKAAGDS